MTTREKLHDIIDNGTDKQIEALLILLILEGNELVCAAHSAGKVVDKREERERRHKD